MISFGLLAGCTGLNGAFDQGETTETDGRSSDGTRPDLDETGPRGTSEGDSAGSNGGSAGGDGTSGDSPPTAGTFGDESTSEDASSSEDGDSSGCDDRATGQGCADIDEPCSGPLDCESRVCVDNFCSVGQCLEYTVHAQHRGTELFPLGDWRQLHHVGGDGVRYFYVAGNAFHSVVENHEVLVLFDHRNQSGALGIHDLTGTANVTHSGVLPGAALASIPNDTSIRIRSNQSLLDLTSTNPDLLNRIRDSRPLHRGVVADNGINAGWSGEGAGSVIIGANPNCTNPDPPCVLHNHPLSACVIHVCGRENGMHWTPHDGLENPYSSDQNPDQHESLSLWVRPPALGSPDPLVATRQNTLNEFRDIELPGLSWVEADFSVDGRCTDADWCHDGVENIDEDGVDCGGSCPPCT